MHTSAYIHQHSFSCCVSHARTRAHKGGDKLGFSLLRLQINICNIFEFFMNSSIKPHVYKVKKTNRVFYIYVSFFAKEPYTQCLFSGKRHATLAVRGVSDVDYTPIICNSSTGGWFGILGGAHEKRLCFIHVTVKNSLGFSTHASSSSSQDRERSEKDRRVYPSHSLRLTLVFFL